MKEHPPALATSLLDLLCNENEALAGDLLEEFRRNQSIGWYWQQVLMAVLIRLSKDLRAHWVLAARAILIGAVTGGLFSFVWTESGCEGLLIRASALVLPEATARWPCFYVRYFLICAVSGWVVARTHRVCTAAMVLAYTTAVFGFLVWDFLRLWSTYTRHAALYWTFGSVMVTGALTGGLLRVARLRNRPTPPHAPAKA
jgi:hypothetical protein